MPVDINFSQSYFWLNSWVMANIIQLSTQSFCDRFVDYKLDPGRRLYDQMTMAARSAVANIAEGASRRNTSIETEMRLTDVARGSIDELQCDYFNFLLRHKADVWAIGNRHREALWGMNLDRAEYSNSLFHDAAAHILRQKSKYEPWTEHADAAVCANAMLILCLRLNKMLQHQLSAQLRVFREKGGFTENMTLERLDAKNARAIEQNAPSCPICGKPMHRRITRKGAGVGREFWGCSDYPRCRGLRDITQ